jgi:protein-L-isoaspartate(D-aspartate) O-methyltransferase
VDEVEQAFRAVPREGFLPRRLRRQAGFDGPLPIGHGQTNSQPRTVADMLRLLDVRPGHRVLDVGSGSCWTTALLGHLTGPTGLVHGVEVVTDLVEWGSANLAVTDMAWTHNHTALPDQLGWPEQAPYDRILVSAEPDTLPQELVDQLAVGGRMVIPVAGRMLVVDRDESDVHHTTHGYYRFVPLL